MKLSFAIFAACSIALTTMACGPETGEGILEENDMWIPENHMRSEGITKNEFYRVTNKLEEIYSPIVATAGGQLSIQKNWESGTVNAYARRKGGEWVVSMFGGLARHHSITSDGFALVVCHELGHHVGGMPKRAWAASEGQSDYYASTKCFRRYVESDENLQIVSNMMIPERVRVFCSLAHDNVEDASVCQRAAMAGKSLAELFHHFSQQHTPLKFETPITEKVKYTYKRHPAPQCRLDTYFHGALCYKDHERGISQDNPHTGYCARTFDDPTGSKTRDTIGSRPRCWYKPKYP